MRIIHKARHAKSAKVPARNGAAVRTRSGDTYVGRKGTKAKAIQDSSNGAPSHYPLSSNLVPSVPDYLRTVAGNTNEVTRTGTLVVCV